MRSSKDIKAAIIDLIFTAIEQRLNSGNLSTTLSVAGSVITVSVHQQETKALKHFNIKVAEL